MVEVCTWQPDGQLAAVVPDREVTAPADAGDGPPVAVLHPIRRRDAEPTVVGASDDDIADRRGQPVSELRRVGVRDEVQVKVKFQASAGESAAGSSR